MKNSVFVVTIVIASLLSNIQPFQLQMIASITSNSKNFFDREYYKAVFPKNPDGVRLFNSLFPLAILNPVQESEIDSLLSMREMFLKDRANMKTSVSYAGITEKELQKLPWYELPKFGIPPLQRFLSKTEIEKCYEKSNFQGQLVWAYKIQFPQKGCLLINHWMQKVYYLFDYDIDRGAKGYEFNHVSLHNPATTIHWPPNSLEIEFVDNSWQAIVVSDNIISGEILRYLPPEMSLATWELLFLLLISPKTEPEVMQTLLDTGLSPQRGYLAYLRLLQKVMQRAEAYDSIPEYRQIVETDITL